MEKGNGLETVRQIKFKDLIILFTYPYFADLLSIHLLRKAYKLILSRLKQKEYSKSYDRKSARRLRRRHYENNHRELPDVKIGGLKHDNIVSYQTRLQTIKCFHLNEILFHVLGKITYEHKRFSEACLI